MNHVRRLSAAAAVAAVALGGVAACGTSAGQGAAPVTASSSSVPSSSSTSSTPSMTMTPADTPSAPPSATSRAASPSPSAPAAITIKQFAFAVPPAVRPGAKVTVTNEDRENHSVTADSAGGFDVKVMHGTPVTFTAPTAAGRYPFHCSFHGTMKGVLVVR